MLNHIGEIQMTLPDSALNLINDIKEKIEHSDDKFALMKLTNFEGLDFYLRSEFDSASAKYFDALELAEELNDIIHKGIILNNLGSLYFDLNQYDNAQKYYDQAYEIMLKENNVKWLSKITGNYAGVSFMQGDMDRSIELLQESIDYGVQAESFISVAGAYGNLAMVLSSLDRKEEALAIFDKGLTMLDSVGDQRGACIVMQKLGDLLAQLGEHDKAQEVLYNTLGMAHEIQHYESIMNAHLTLSKFYETQGQVDSSLNHLKQYIQWKDSVFNQESFETISELEQKYQTAQKQAEIVRLEAEKQEEKAKTQAKQLENYILWLGIGISLIVIVFVLIQFISKRNSNKILSEKNKIIEANLSEKEVLMREIHHRVKNNFQLVSGVLMIQASNSKDEGIKQALLDVRNRIQSMASTHQKLYQSDSISEIEVKPFLEDLIEEIELGYSHENVLLKTELSRGLIPVDIAVNLGLILTEGMINAYKYAFQNGGELKIKVSLDSNLLLEVIDNGPGFDQSATTNSFGLKMIKSLAKKAGGNAAWISENGTTLRVKLPVS